MLNPSDPLIRKLTAEMMNAGVSVAAKGLALSSFTNILDQFAFTTQRAVDYTTFLAIRRYLYELGVPHSSYLSSPFTDPDQQNLVLGGRRCIIQTELIHRKDDIHVLRRFPETILDKEARFPISPENIWEEDLLVFAFMSGLLARSPSEIHKAFQAQQPLSLVHTLPVKRRSRQHWSPLGVISLKTDAKRTLQFELGGQRKDRMHCVEKISIPPGEAIRIDTSFYSLTYIKSEEPVFERLAIRSRLFPQLYIVHPHQWHNIWVYGLELTLAGYMTWSEFRGKAVLDSKCENSTAANPSGNGRLCLPVDELHPLGPLLERVGKRGRAPSGGPASVTK